jgi:titin
MNTIALSHPGKRLDLRGPSLRGPIPRLIAAIVLLLALTGLGAGLSGAANRPATTCTVTNTADSGAGTLRQCLLDAASGDTITFDVGVFPPASPATIAITSGQLPDLDDGNVTLDASNAGVILDGAGAPGAHGLRITSGGNRVMGLQILHFPGDGIQVSGNAQWNIIGGDRTTGSGPLGQGNVISGNGNNGIVFSGAGVASNTVSGNRIGTNAAGTEVIGNGQWGVHIGGGASANTIGGATEGRRNVISGNNWGIGVADPGTNNNVIRGNYIGTDATGTVDLGNTWEGVDVYSGAQHTTIRDNLVSGNNNWGVYLESSGTSHNVVSGNRIGTDATGSLGLGNSSGGVNVCCEATDNLVGGDEPAERNIISGNGGSAVSISGSGTTSNTVSGNYVGVDVSGTAALGNGGNAVHIYDGAAYNVIGGGTAGERNVISGNDYGAVINGGHHNRIAGNYLGLDSSGTAPLGNSSAGAGIGGDEYNVIENNVIAANDWVGVS